MAHNPGPTHQGIPHTGLKNDSGVSTWSRQTTEMQFRIFWGIRHHLDLSGLEIVRMGDGIAVGTVMRDAASSPNGM